jgi:hypothetical protein
VLRIESKSLNSYTSSTPYLIFLLLPLPGLPLNLRSSSATSEVAGVIGMNYKTQLIFFLFDRNILSVVIGKTSQDVRPNVGLPKDAVGAPPSP